VPTCRLGPSDRPKGLDPVRALQRVLYRSAKQDRTRRFHALFDKVTRSDVMWRAWVDVATNQGAAGVDGVSIASGRVWVLDADIKACFDNIDHDAVMGQVERRVVDRQMLKLLRSWLRAGVFEGGVVSGSDAGTPQGSPISPLLANVALHVLDEAWDGDGRRLGTLGQAMARVSPLLSWNDDERVLLTTYAQLAA
jgi:hypothetical protein